MSVYELEVFVAGEVIDVLALTTAVVDADHPVAMVNERLAEVTTDESRTPAAGPPLFYRTSHIGGS